MIRGQANLPALAIALLVLTSVTVISLTVADGAYASADRKPEQRQLAVALSERLVSPESSLTTRANVLNASALDRFDSGRLDANFPFVRNVGVRVRVDGETVVDSTSSAGGSTIRRVVLVEDRQEVTIQPPLSAPNYTTTLPRRTSKAIVHIDPPAATRVRTVRANGRVVLHDPTGLDGDVAVQLSRFETTQLRFDVDGPLPSNSIWITYYPANSVKAVLEVTVRG